MKEKFLKQLFQKSKLILVFERKKHFDDFLVNCTFFPNISLPFIFLQQKSRDVLLGFFFREKIIEPPKGLPSLNSCKFCVITTFQVSYEKSETGEWGPNEKFLSIKIGKKKFSTHNLTY